VAARSQPPLIGWPDEAGPTRSAKIVQAVQSGDFEHQWCPIDLTDGANTLRVLVSCDALEIEGVRVNVTARIQQEIADILGAVLLTPKLVDQIFKNATPANRLSPSRQMRPITSSTAGMIEHSQKVDEIGADSGAAIPPPVANPGKDWVLAKVIFTPGARAKDKAANYGWLTRERLLGSDGPTVSLPGVLAVQTVGTHHDATNHTDYSQIARFAHRSAVFNGQTVDLADVYTGRAPAEATALVSHEGALPSAQQPGVVSNGGPIPLPTPGGAPPPPPPAAPTGGSGKGVLVATSLLGAGIGGLTGGGAGAAVGTVAGVVVGAILRKRA